MADSSDLVTTAAVTASAVAGVPPTSPSDGSQSYGPSYPFDATPSEVLAALDAGGVGVTGAGITVGVLSDSFNDLGGAARDEADGALPAAADIDVLRDYSAGGTDEGRAMMQIVHDIAPGANLDFYTADISEQQFADGILALAAAGCKVICDDVSYFDEPFFQTGIIAQAIQTVEQEGVIYLTAAGNDADNGYQAHWNPIAQTSFDGTTLTDAQNFGGGSALETVKIGSTDGTSVPLVFEWNQPYGSVTSDLEVVVFKNGALYGTVTNDSATGHLTLAADEAGNPCIIVELPGNATYQIAIENLSGPDPGLIGEMSEADGYPITMTVDGQPVDDGTVQGHHMSPDAITVGAVDAGNTPGNGGALESEPFSSSGLNTQLFFNFNGTTIAGAPIELHPVAISGVDDIDTSVSGDLSDFFGTSAATPSVAAVVALMLQENRALTFQEVESILEDTATSGSQLNPDVAGAGLVDAARAVQSAAAAPPPATGRLVSGAYTNSATTPSLVVANASFGGNIVNAGNITANGITVSKSTMSGAILDSGIVSGGIGLDNRSKIINAAGAGIAVTGPTFVGNISNGGAISSPAQTGVSIDGVTTFQGGINNTGTISGTVAVAVAQTASFLGVILNNAGGTLAGAVAGIALDDDATFWGGIENNSIIRTPGGAGIELDDVGFFQGQVAEVSGTITAATGIRIIDSTMTGGIADGGTITATSRGIFIDSASRIVAQSSTAGILVTGPTLAGGISNCGVISAGATGIWVHSAAKFSGGITNEGAIVGGTTGIAVSTVAIFNNTGGEGGITNTGAIEALSENGIRVHIGTTFVGDIVNSGTISAAATGIEVFGVSTFSGAVSNFGTICGSAGIFISATTSVSVFDSGEIVGSGGPAVEFTRGVNTFTLGPGYEIGGDVIGAGSDILRLGGSGSGSFDLGDVGAGRQYQGFAAFDVIGATWSVSGAGSDWQIESGATLEVANGGTLADTTVSSGALVVLSGGLADSTAVGQGGSEVVSAGGVAESVVIDGGTVALSSAAFVSGAIAFMASGALDFAGSGSALSAFMAGIAVTGLGGGDVIDLVDVASTSAATVSASSDELFITVGGVAYDLTLGTPLASGTTLALAPDQNTGTELVLAGGSAGNSGNGGSSGTVAELPYPLTSGQLLLLGSYIASLFAAAEGQMAPAETGTLPALHLLVRPH